MRCFLGLILLQIWNYRPVDGQRDTSANLKSRLVNGLSRCAGRLEVHYDGNWWTAYASGWQEWYGSIVCQELGCGDALDVPLNDRFEGVQRSYLSIDCQGSTTSLQCKLLSYTYGNSREVDIICAGHRFPKLVSGPDECSGRLEMQFGNTWGTVCDQNWDMEDANVVCQQLQCGIAVSVLGGAHFGAGNGAIQNGLLNCWGNESSVLDCPLSSGNQGCYHKNDVSIICSDLVPGVDSPDAPELIASGTDNLLTVSQDDNKN